MLRRQGGLEPNTIRVDLALYRHIFPQSLWISLMLAWLLFTWHFLLQLGRLHVRQHSDVALEGEHPKHIVLAIPYWENLGTTTRISDTGNGIQHS